MVTITSHICSVESLALGEPLLGTAPRADVWFALEVPMPWGDKAFEESSLPEEIKAHVGAQVKAISEARLVLIRQSGNLRDGITFFAALSAAAPPALYRFQLNDYSELLKLDLASIVAQDPMHSHALVNEPAFFVCTNGRRDQCCALHGAAVFRAIRAKFGDTVWESTHHGGHRFAANLLQMPSGHSYGRLRADNAASVVQTAVEGNIEYEHFRGRSVYAEPIQAAEGLLREKLGLKAEEPLRLISGLPLENKQWRVRFAHNGRAYDVLVEAKTTGEQVHLSCGDEKMGPVVNYQLIDHKIA